MVHLSRQLRRRNPSAQTIAQLSALAVIVSAGPLSVGQLAEIEGLPSPAVTRLADRLEEADLIERRANPEDRRGIHLVATARGIELLERRAEAGTSWLAERIAVLGESDHQALERAVTVLEAMVAECRGEQPKAKVQQDHDDGRKGRPLQGVSR
jgi:DNA-binding MarR family transcriptional regulator